MSSGIRWWRRDLPLRALGAALLAVGILAARHLFRHAQGGQAATVYQLVLATFAFAGCSLGAALASLGAHVHDEVVIAERWRARHPDRQIVERSSSPSLPGCSEQRNPDLCSSDRGMGAGPWSR